MKAFAEWVETFIVPNPRNYVVASLAIIGTAIATGVLLAHIVIPI